MNVQTLNEKLVTYRAQQRLSLREMAEMLRITSGSTINNWEHGDPIPGPASLLLEWLIDGKVPFEESRLQKLPSVVKEAALKVTMELGAWERLDALRIAGGYATVTDMIGGWIQEELGEGGLSEGGDAGGGHLDAAAEAFAQANPLPAAGEAGGTAGTTGARKGGRYTRPPGMSGTGEGKRK